MYEAKFQKINLQTAEKVEVEAFLAHFDLTLDKDVEYTLVARIQDRIVGTCSFAGNVIKSFALKEALQGEGIASKLITHITNEMFDRGIYQTFIFTKPSNRHLFEGFGYHEIYATNDVILLESGLVNIEKYIKNMFNKSQLGNEEKAAIVMNCNPFTLGHQNLIEIASKENKSVVVFIVEEDRSLFPFNVRYNLVKEGTKHLRNVHVLPGGNYIISANTFPSYFIKEDEKKDKAFKELDAGIFGKYIAPAFNIKSRYVGTEPFCATTDGYNKALLEVLPNFGVALKILKRFDIDERAISASAVRALIKNDDWGQIEKLVPETTLTFLRSPQAEKIIDIIKTSETRH
ncbi:citrate lyase ligase [Alkaliphilus metalliredigens QYMF]|uniref:[Citrate [pro-3S]-lyase] ligase n=1 Tax=Alkaliphilus metalliredigens (strain QYMF) TaxID=293826 RepID=A6TSE0_ALKMQ|nr:[citrate (pro-3S)-lyase] ligase [Alkaliphilus metalliredigens]ABR49108.1 citrate lyase ligase [Alkaliphilus metalliredigens QYMF]